MVINCSLLLKNKRSRSMAVNALHSFLNYFDRTYGKRAGLEGAKKDAVYHINDWLHLREDGTRPKDYDATNNSSETSNHKLKHLYMKNKNMQLHQSLRAFCHCLQHYVDHIHRSPRTRNTRGANKHRKPCKVYFMPPDMYDKRDADEVFDDIERKLVNKSEAKKRSLNIQRNIEAAKKYLKDMEELKRNHSCSQFPSFEEVLATGRRPGRCRRQPGRGCSQR